MVSSNSNYNALIGRDWIHSWWAIPSSLHQFLVFWNGNKVEVVWADGHPFVAKVNAAEAILYDDEIGPVRFYRKDKY